MKQQYLGDVNDFRKYCLLRHFADGGKIRIGIFWMLTPDDRGRDGKKISYLSQPTAWRDHDPDLFDRLKNIVHGEEGRLLKRIEECGIIAGASYFEEITPDDLEARRVHYERSLVKLEVSDLIFCDPDNGIEVTSRPKGRKNSSKYLYWDEIADAFRPCRSLLIYQHFTRENRSTFMTRLAQKTREVTNAEAIWTLCSPHVLFVLATSDPRIASLAETLPARFEMPPLRIVAEKR